MSGAKRRHPVATGTKNRVVLVEPHVLVLVAGTVDPTNFWEDLNKPIDKETTTHGRSYSERGEKKRDPKYWSKAAENSKDAHDENWYWETNPDFRKAIFELRKQVPSLHIFTMHGWTADNAIRNREIAGQYLCDRLCGGGDEKPYYEAWLKRPVSFHLMGHSHGGNVINEFTRRAATSTAWPKKWKIRSITYLSTPFFPSLHKIDTGAFHDDCEVLNVFNKYDLTQRVVADFNLFQLNGIAKLASIDALLEKVRALRFDGQLLWALTPSGVEDVAEGWMNVDLRAVMDPARARTLYAGCLNVLDQLEAIFNEVLAIVDKLHRGVMFPVAIQLKDRVCAGREVLSASLANRYRAEISRLFSGMALARASLKARMASGVYPVDEFLNDIHPLDFVEPLIAFLETDPQTFSGRFAGLLHSTLVEQLERFDNTTHTPAAKLKGTSFSSKLTLFDVTKHDLYMEREARDCRPHFDVLISRLEEIERRYAATKSQKDLLDLLFTLAAQVPAIRDILTPWLDAVVWADRSAKAIEWADRLNSWLMGEQASRLVSLVRRLARVLRTFAEILHSRDVGRLVISPEELPPKRPTDPAVGELDHFMRVSHSVSRDDLYPEVREKLLKQMQPQRRR